MFWFYEIWVKSLYNYKKFSNEYKPFALLNEIKQIMYSRGPVRTWFSLFARYMEALVWPRTGKNCHSKWVPQAVEQTCGCRYLLWQRSSNNSGRWLKKKLVWYDTATNKQKEKSKKTAESRYLAIMFLCQLSAHKNGYGRLIGDTKINSYTVTTNIQNSGDCTHTPAQLEVFKYNPKNFSRQVVNSNDGIAFAISSTKSMPKR